MNSMYISLSLFCLVFDGDEMHTKGKILVLSMNTDSNLSSKRFYCVGS